MRRLPLLAFSAALSIGASGASYAQGTQPYVGAIISVPYNFCPAGWLEANGQLVPIVQYEVLYNLIGTTYGGDGQTTFALPNPPEPTAPGVPPKGGYFMRCISMFGVFPSQN